MAAFLPTFVLVMSITFDICNGVSSKTSRDELYRPLYYKRLKAERQMRLEEEKNNNQQPIKIKVTSRVSEGRKLSDKCQDYESLIKAKSSLKYFKDPVKCLKAEYDKININSEPEESYYTLVLKVNKAVEEDILIPIRGTYVKGQRGIVTQSYQVSLYGTRLRLVSHFALPQANKYFRSKIDSDCVTISDDNIRTKNRNVPRLGEDQHIKSSPFTYSDRNIDKYRSEGSSDCHSSKTVEQLKTEMEGININSKPGSLYFKLVLDVYKAVLCNILMAIADTINTGLRGIHTELYRVVADDTFIQLASITDRYKAWAFLRSKNSALNVRAARRQEGPEEGENKNNRKPGILEMGRAQTLRHIRGGAIAKKLGTTKKIF